MTTLYQDIRGCLQTRANTATGIPGSAQRAYEGVPFAPTVGTAYIAYTLIPTQERPASLGPSGQTLRQGLFQVSLFYPSGSGTGTVESIADAVKNVFVAGNTLTQGTTSVRIRYAERGQCTVSADWIQCNVTVAWDLHTPTTP